MTQTVKSWSSQRYLITRTEVDCSGKHDTYGALNKGQFYSYTNDAEHRPYPKDLKQRPWMYLTSQPLQKTQYYEYGVYADGPYVWTRRSCCYGCAPMEWTRLIRAAFAPCKVWGPVMRQPEESDWRLQLFSKIKDISVNLASNLAEYRETCDMFAGFAGGVRDAWKVARGKLPRRKLTTCDVASTWLAVSWGIKPLADDLVDSVFKLNEKIAEPLYRKVVVGGDVDDYFDFDGHKGAALSSDRARFYVKLVTNGYDFTTGNLAEMAYEVTPFSVILDWGIPIGEYLSSLDALKYVEDLRGTCTHKFAYRHLYRPPGLDGLFPGVRIEKPGKVLYRSHKRTLWVDGMIPYPPFPKWDPSQSWRKVAHSLSMLKSMNSSCKRPPGLTVKAPK